jgi:cardiolipin synthase
LYFASEGLRILPAIIVVVAGISDFLDGYLARKLNCESKFGALLDPIADKIFCNAAAFNLMLDSLKTDTSQSSTILFMIMLSRDLLLMIGSAYVFIMKIEANLKPVYISKICTTLIFLLLISVLSLRTDSLLLAVLEWICIVLVILSAAIYLVRFKRVDIAALIILFFMSTIVFKDPFMPTLGFACAFLPILASAVYIAKLERSLRTVLICMLCTFALMFIVGNPLIFFLKLVVAPSIKFIRLVIDPLLDSLGWPCVFPLIVLAAAFCVIKASGSKQESK